MIKGSHLLPVLALSIGVTFNLYNLRHDTAVLDDGVPDAIVHVEILNADGTNLSAF